MNNQITILDRNNQSINVDLICYFKSEQKKYVFYNKNEIVQDGLIKMYVAEENNGLTNDITQDEWNNLKKVMQGIITGNAVGVEFLTYSSPVKFNEPKAIALNDTNINAIKTFYKNTVGVSGGSEPILNKDILSQSFGNNTEVSVNAPEPVQISSIPNVQNDFNMESTPVNLNTTPIVENNQNVVPEIEPVSSVPNIEPINSTPAIPSIEPIEPIVSNDSINSDPVLPTIEPISNIGFTPVSEQTQMSGVEGNVSPLNINSIKPGGIDSGFRVSNEPNIFDNPSMPYQITEEEINNPAMPEVSNTFNNVPDVTTLNNISNNVNNNEINTKKIELNNKKIKLFEELANIYREENEMLQKESNDNEVLEKTASNLFNSNGTLNDSEVLG